MAIELAVGGEREGLEEHEGRGQHVVGQVCWRDAHAVGCWHRCVPVHQRDIGDESLSSGITRGASTDGFAHGRMLSELRLDLAAARCGSRES